MVNNRKFSPGSDWLYIKIYTGIKTADIILQEVIHPLTEYFLLQKYILKWFFIRYNDPEAHLRIRFKVTRKELFVEIGNVLNQELQKYLDSGEISNISFDTYVREVERYGDRNIEDAETLFHINSKLTLHFLNYEDEEKIVFSLFYINEILDRLNISDWEKLEWMKIFNNNFKREFHADKKLNTQLDKKYRQLKPMILNFINADDFLQERNFILQSINEKKIPLQNINSYYKNDSLKIPLQDFFQSIFHMNINRLFISNQRLFEMIIYDYLYRYYKSVNFM